MSSSDANTSQSQSFEHAVQAGGDILQRFRQAKAKDSSFVSGLTNRSLQQNEETSVSVGYFDAIADGSNLGLAYSASKKRDRDVNASSSMLFMATPAERDPTAKPRSDSEPIELVRGILARLAFLEQNDKENMTKDIKDIIFMMQVSHHFHFRNAAHAPLFSLILHATHTTLSSLFISSSPGR